MTLEITTITTPFILHITVNCYLVRIEHGFVLIDTGKSGQRHVIEAELTKAGCLPGDLKLIVLTHGDFDHCGNAAYFRETYQTKIAMHELDRGMVEQGDMFYNRKPPNFVAKGLTGLLFRLKKEDRFTPDFFIQEGDSLADYGLTARVIELPGHSRGSVGLLTRDCDLFCGDLLANTNKPAIWSIIDDHEAANASVEKLKDVVVIGVYPGHGKPFSMDVFWAEFHRRQAQQGRRLSPSM